MIQAPCCHARTDIRTRGLGRFIARITSANAAIAAGATETTRFPHFDASEYVLFPIDTAQCAGKGHTSARCRPAAQLVLLGAEFSKNPRGIPRYETGRSQVGVSWNSVVGNDDAPSARSCSGASNAESPPQRMSSEAKTAGTVFSFIMSSL